MNYRTFGKTGWQASALGFGTMRLPTTDGLNRGPNIDEKQSAELIYFGIENGINYIDTAYPYHREQSELFLGKILQGKWRQQVKLATKLPTWKIETYDDFDKYLNEQLNKLQTDRIELYLLHSLNRKVYDKIYNLGVLDWAEAKKKEGKIEFIGFSFHDDLAAFKHIIDSYGSWEFCQIQHNYMNIDFQAGTEGLHYAHERGIPVVIMEPLFGGKLAKAPDSILEIMNSVPAKYTPAQWALFWLWNQPEVNVILSGMNSMEQLKENIESASQSQIGMLSEADLKMIDKVRWQYQAISLIPCTGCNYCQPCPNDVNIPHIFSLFNEGSMYDDLPESRQLYGFMNEAHRADQCIECGECESACPQSIEIIDWLKKADAVLAQGKSYEEVLAE